ncbi:MAG: tyrosine-type recombinase/integrase [Blastocatellia bacterium]
MNGNNSLPHLIDLAGALAARRFVEFFTVNIRNKNTRLAYGRAAAAFLEWCEQRGLPELGAVQPVHVSAYIEHLQRRHSAPTVKQHLATIRMLFDWLVTGQVVPSNPAHSVRGPRYSVSKGTTPVLSSEEARELLDSIDTSSLTGLRDRALIGLMTYTFARVSAAAALKVEDYYPQKKRWWVRLHEKNGKVNEMPCHHNLETYLDEYVHGAGIADDRKGPFFRTAIGKTGQLTDQAMTRADVYRMIKRRARAVGIETHIGCHTFRATGITAYLKNGGRIEVAQRMAGHSNAKTTGLYDRRSDEISLDEVERIAI